MPWAICSLDWQMHHSHGVREEHQTNDSVVSSNQAWIQCNEPANMSSLLLLVENRELVIKIDGVLMWSNVSWTVMSLKEYYHFATFVTTWWSSLSEDCQQEQRVVNGWRNPNEPLPFCDRSWVKDCEQATNSCFQLDLLQDRI